jgi:hypothetical protein
VEAFVLQVGGDVGQDPSHAVVAQAGHTVPASMQVVGTGIVDPDPYVFGPPGSGSRPVN